ncbi:MAG: hypothetical protein QOE05_2334 [Actinomycetota bacterium]|nr:hypothetical protein [Actinomycetota bacterium]
MAAELAHPAILDDRHAVGVVRRVQAVRDSDDRAVLEDGGERPLEVSGRPRVEQRGRLVQHQRVRVGEDQPGQRHLLRLGGVQRDTTVAHHGVQPGRQPVRPFQGVHGPRTGRVALGGVALLDLPLDRLRREVALVTQEHHVFVGTLADNLRLAREDATDEELLAARAAVDADGGALGLPDGLATRVGSGGLALSPAQAQQVALARLVLADPHTLVLDEATSLLDRGAARSLERSLGRVLEGRTVVAVAHRLHTAHDADRVAVVDEGRVAELGSHDELLAAGGSYAALWHAWQSDATTAR